MAPETDARARRARARLTRATGRGFWLRTGLVAVLDALVVWAVPTLVVDRAFTLLVLLVLSTAALNWAYLDPRASAARWLTPGLVLMGVFVVFPIVYTVYISTTNWATGNVLSKDQVIEQLEAREIAGSGGEVLPISIYRGPDDALALLVAGDDREPFLGLVREAGTEPGDPQPVAELDDVDPADPPAEIAGFTLLSSLQATGEAGRLQGAEVDLPDGSRARVDTLSTARVTEATSRFDYDPDSDVLVDNELDVTCTEGEGQFVCDDVDESVVSPTAREARGITCSGGRCDDVPLFAIDGTLPGWRTVVGADNYVDVLTNERIRGPFLRVLVWNVVFAGGTVLLAFALGLGLALLLRDESLRGRALYRSIFIIPYAIPAFLSIFVWRGLLNKEFGKVNGLLESVGLSGVDWLGSPWWAMVAVLLVNLWLGFPYMFLITSGALTSIPEELLEAARVDGAGAWTSFRQITLPLLLVSTAPLLIGAFAFNFNNFALIYLLTQGGPPLSGYDVPVGATDILISFTFDLAQGAGRGNQFGLATAIIVVIFVVLATVSASSFRLTRRLEDVYE